MRVPGPMRTTANQTQQRRVAERAHNGALPLNATNFATDQTISALPMEGADALQMTSKVLASPISRVYASIHTRRTATGVKYLEPIF